MQQEVQKIAEEAKEKQEKLNQLEETRKREGEIKEGEEAKRRLTALLARSKNVQLSLACRSMAIRWLSRL